VLFIFSIFETYVFQDLTEFYVWNGDTHKGEQNSVPPGFTGTTVTLNNIQIIEGETKDFMEDYQRSITPASLSLYFYIAYQFILYR
jgi:hypothetical protein